MYLYSIRLKVQAPIFNLTGISQFLWSISPSGRADLYEPHWMLTNLDPYEHLECILRLCITHFHWNITKTHCHAYVQKVMRGLMCHHHTAWNETLKYIATYGGKAGNDWLQDKI
ncbi:hypothetical protein Moror_5093 [Moniliophthora roreri MCA 2997]|uniref:Uncharacterized protein n=1 Tax=Moniliophthora roreri (strain MCA 2997) TaxID=1381753 RepID=V2W439_MONRO|nr:hypothetical protein Moror_5093 [Moniliophthora roreri MCA 2997]